MSRWPRSPASMNLLYLGLNPSKTERYSLHQSLTATSAFMTLTPRSQSLFFVKLDQLPRVQTRQPTKNWRKLEVLFQGEARLAKQHGLHDLVFQGLVVMALSNVLYGDLHDRRLFITCKSHKNIFQNLRLLRLQHSFFSFLLLRGLWTPECVKFRLYKADSISWTAGRHFVSFWSKIQPWFMVYVQFFGDNFVDFNVSQSSFKFFQWHFEFEVYAIQRKRRNE